MDIKCLYCDHNFTHTSSWAAPKCPKCSEGTYLKQLKDTNLGDVFGYRFTESKEKKPKNTNTNSNMYGEYTD